MKMNRTHILSSLLVFLFGISSFAQNVKVEMLPFGKMDQWITRQVKESFIIGGNTRDLYEIAGPEAQVGPNEAYKNIKSPWATSSVYANVKGISKGSVTVFPEKCDNGYAARLETRVENVKVLGIIHINVLASGTIFLGEMLEPITDTDNPHSKLDVGMPFTKRPDALQFDYKVTTGGEKRKINGFSAKGEKVPGKDMAEVYIILQHRWEDAQGGVHAKRIATGWERFDHSVDTWQNAHRIDLKYGDISKTEYYKDYMHLHTGEAADYTRNSKGQLVPIQVEGWGNADEEVTHMILQFSSSNGGPYIGNPNSKLWIDNVGLVYKVD